MEEQEESILEAFREDFPHFIEAGFIAIKQLDEIAARRLFKAAEAIHPENPAAQLGLGYVALNKLRVAEATTIFEGILEKDPEHHLARALLGVSYFLTPDKKKQGEELIREAKKRSDDPTIKNLADVCLDWQKKDLSGTSLPPLKSL